MTCHICQTLDGHTKQRYMMLFQKLQVHENGLHGSSPCLDSTKNCVFKNISNPLLIYFIHAYIDENISNILAYKKKQKISIGNIIF